MADEILVVMITCPDAETSGRIASTLVQERLAACVNQLAGIVSTYRWEEQVQTDTEVLLLAKTTRMRLAALEQRTRTLHPYELPEIVALPLCGGSGRYLEWIRRSVDSGKGPSL